MALNQLKPGKRTVLFLGSDCYNEEQIVQGLKIIKNPEVHGWKHDKQRLFNIQRYVEDFNIVDCSTLDEDLELEQMSCLIESELQVQFKAAKGNALYIFYSGISYQNGDWAISKKGNSDRLLRISLSYIVNKWNQLKNGDLIPKKLKLIIFMDSSYSGAWCRRIKMLKNESKDISIFASSRETQRTVDDEGGLFFKCLLSSHLQDFKYDFCKMIRHQKPCYAIPQSGAVLPLGFQQLFQLCKDFTRATEASKFPLPIIIPKEKLINDISSTAQETYTGNFMISQDQMRKCRHGYGKLIVKSGVNKGRQYDGYFKDGLFHGLGTLKESNGYFYYGLFQFGKKHGFAEQSIPNANQKYIGMFNNGLRHGEGSLLFFGGNQYRGTFKQGKRQGYGSMIYSFGVYEGYWKNGLRHGEGLLREKDKSFYEGYWENDQRHGYGCYYSSISNVSYKGLFLNDKKQGNFQEIHYHENTGKTIFTGNYINDRKHGQFIVSEQLLDNQNKPVGTQQIIIYYENGMQIQNPLRPSLLLSQDGSQANRNSGQLGRMH